MTDDRQEYRKERKGYRASVRVGLLNIFDSKLHILHTVICAKRLLFMLRC